MALIPSSSRFQEIPLTQNGSDELFSIGGNSHTGRPCGSPHEESLAIPVKGSLRIRKFSEIDRDRGLNCIIQLQIPESNQDDWSIQPSPCSIVCNSSGTFKGEMLIRRNSDKQTIKVDAEINIHQPEDNTPPAAKAISVTLRVHCPDFTPNHDDPIIVNALKNHIYAPPIEQAVGAQR